MPVGCFAHLSGVSCWTRISRGLGSVRCHCATGRIRRLVTVRSARALWMLAVLGGLYREPAFYQALGLTEPHIGAALAGFAVAAIFEDNWGDTEVQRLVLACSPSPSSSTTRWRRPRRAASLRWHPSATTTPRGGRYR